MAIHTPVNRLPTSVNSTLVVDFLKNLNISGIVVVRVCEVRIVPFSQHTQTFKA